MLPHSITGNPSNPILVLIAGFPDDEISGKITFYFEILLFSQKYLIFMVI